ESGRSRSGLAPVDQWIEQRFPKPLCKGTGSPRRRSGMAGQRKPGLELILEPAAKTAVSTPYFATSKSESSRKCSIHEQAGDFAITPREKSAGLRRFCKALFRTRTGDILLTVSAPRQADARAAAVRK